MGFENPTNGSKEKHASSEKIIEETVRGVEKAFSPETERRLRDSYFKEHPWYNPIVLGPASSQEEREKYETAEMAHKRIEDDIINDNLQEEVRQALLRYETTDEEIEEIAYQLIVKDLAGGLDSFMTADSNGYEVPVELGLKLAKRLIDDGHVESLTRCKRLFDNETREYIESLAKQKK